MDLKIKMSNEDKDKFLHNLTEILKEVIKTEYYQTIDYDFSRGSRVYVFTILTIEWYSGDGYKRTYTSKFPFARCVDTLDVEFMTWLTKQPIEQVIDKGIIELRDMYYNQ